MHTHRLITPFLILVTVAVFWRAAYCGFLGYDDPDYVANNPQVLQGLSPSNVAWAFTTDHAANYHPLTWLSLMLDSDLWGVTPLKPQGYHITNILLHALAAVLLYLSLHALTGSCWRSALVSVLFAVHPLRVESVAWISERKDVLSGCFAFAALWAYAVYARSPRWGCYLLVLGLLLLGLLAKPMLVTLPCLFLLLDVWPLRRLSIPALAAPSSDPPVCPAWTAGALILEKIPFLVLSTAAGVVTYLAQRRGNAVVTFKRLPWSIRLVNIFVAYVRYLVKMVWFRGLVVLYPLTAEPLWKSAVAAAILVLVTVLVLIRFRSKPFLAIGWFWYLGMLVPAIGVIQVGIEGTADRYAYLPTIGLLVMAVWCLPERLGQTRAGRAGLATATLAIVTCLGAFTWRQIGYWHDGVALFSHAAHFYPENPEAMRCLGIEEVTCGRTEDALADYQRAVELDPRSSSSQASLGILLQQLAKTRKSPAMLDQAMDHLRLAIWYEPDNIPAHNGIGVVYMQRRQTDLAAREFRQVLSLDPSYPPANINLGAILMDRKQYAQALPYIERALKVDPDNVIIYSSMVRALGNLGRNQEALPYVREIIRRRPDLAQAQAVLARILLRLHQVDEAVAAAQKAVELDPGSGEFRALLGQTQAVQKGRGQASQPASARR